MRPRLFACLCYTIWLVPPTSLSRATDPAAIDKAAARGVRYLRSQQEHSTGLWPYREDPVGAGALAALTLLECGAPVTDADVLRAANALRRAAIDLTRTYAISLELLFLDRLGDPDDEPFIHSLAVRLIAGQNDSGGWSYECPPPGADEQKKLTDLLRSKRTKNRAGRSGQLPNDVQNQLRSIRPRRMGPRWSDNSNTKFATLALWVARRHSIPSTDALRAVETRFRRSQNPDGGWGYLPEGRLNETLGSMTCAGLLGLAVGRGVASFSTQPGEQTDEPAVDRIGDDRAIREGLLLLARIIGKPILSDEIDGIKLFGFKEGDPYYFLWALERVAVAYDLRTIGSHDWYEWGSAWLLKAQQSSGGWSSKYGQGGVDTCFALLFLKRANLSRDLTVSLQGQVGDPADRAMRRPPTSSPKPLRPPAAPAPEREPDTSSAAVPSSGQLRDALLQAPAAKRPQLIDEYRDHKGAEYTQALLEAIAGLDPAMRSQARDALAERLTRMTSATLRGRLQDGNVEMRRAAALACGMKGDKSLIPDLIARLDDSNAAIVKASALALQTLSGKNFGPKSSASQSERATSIQQWREWWANQAH